MSQIIITKTDRRPSQELDLRKSKLSKSKNEITIFKLNEEGEVVGVIYTSLYYGGDSLIRDYRSLLEGRFKENKLDSGFFSTYISKDKLKTFIKFANKNGKVVELNNESTEKSLKILKDMCEGVKDLHISKSSLESTFKNVNLLTKGERWRKINYKNIIIFSNNNGYQSNIKISDRNRNITHSVNSSHSSFDFKLIEEKRNYYAFFDFGTPTRVLSAGVKGVKKYLDICEKISYQNERTLDFIKKQLKEMFI